MKTTVFVFVPTTEYATNGRVNDKMVLKIEQRRIDFYFARFSRGISDVSNLIVFIFFSGWGRRSVTTYFRARSLRLPCTCVPHKYQLRRSVVAVLDPNPGRFSDTSPPLPVCVIAWDVIDTKCTDMFAVVT